MPANNLDIQKPKSATHGLVALSGLAFFLLGAIFIKFGNDLGGDIVICALFLIACQTIGIFVPDLVWQKTYLRASTGLNWTGFSPNWTRSIIKILGFWGTIGLLAFFYWVFPEYRGGFYERYFKAFEFIAPYLAIASIPYIFFVDGVMREPHDGYWNMGMILMLQWHRVDELIFRQHLLSWLVKGFFIPLMFIYMCNDLVKFIAVDFSTVNSFQKFWDFSWDFLYFIDVGMATMAYIMAFRILDTQTRSTEPTMFGWVVALCCYEPFWSLIGRLFLAYDTGFPWGEWLWNYPVAYGAWGSIILFLTLIYVWSSVIFGGRFSNLTNRGVITNGPYSFTKHPAYIAKNLSWWMLSIPFMAGMNEFEVLRHCLLLLGLNLIYALRAKTEERHLSADPDYVAYANWIDQHGILRWTRHIPILKFFAYKQNEIAKL
ncbi:isoprenylcysteine carboxylmethyltransferase family protein [Polynucleobacter alcilacus]|uniref:isoprenylcysteine carboxylmethyltransferase family protein n=1 Tax=Polynucleobacter alcilacus TaxID=1819739 RepID=UPI001C0B6CC2|nr:isoprenylcysteine carboxylmethyltransferase family protein [Polynucleobacter alcilacus]MBU3566941.1 isoprenylcysteine carboxyl methyltransferase [Polynucleobacter alcilacus]